MNSIHQWSQFKNLDGYFLRVSKQGLRKESLSTGRRRREPSLR